MSKAAYVFGWVSAMCCFVVVSAQNTAAEPWTCPPGYTFSTSLQSAAGGPGCAPCDEPGTVCLGPPTPCASPAGGYFGFLWGVDNTSRTIDTSAYPAIFRGGSNTAKTLYGNVGILPQYSGGAPVNGGIPQRGNVSVHLTRMLSDLTSTTKGIPDVNISGLCVMDFETFRADLNSTPSSATAPVRPASYNYTRDSLGPAAVAAMSVADYEARVAADFADAARRFLAGSMAALRRARQRCMWGQYGYPRNDFAQGGYIGGLAEHYRAVNDGVLAWLWRSAVGLPPSRVAQLASALNESGWDASLLSLNQAILPNIYLGGPLRSPHDGQTTEVYVSSTVGEAVRLARAGAAATAALLRAADGQPASASPSPSAVPVPAAGEPSVGFAWVPPSSHPFWPPEPRLLNPADDGSPAAAAALPVPLPVIPMAWYVYNTYPRPAADKWTYVTANDTRTLLLTAAGAGARGIMLWGATSQSLPFTHEGLQNHVHAVLGPTVQRVTDEICGWDAAPGGAIPTPQPCLPGIPQAAADAELDRLLAAAGVRLVAQGLVSTANCTSTAVRGLWTCPVACAPGFAAIGSPAGGIPAGMGNVTCSNARGIIGWGPAAACQPCPSGSITAAVGAAACTACPPASEPSANRTACAEVIPPSAAPTASATSTPARSAGASATSSPAVSRTADNAGGSASNGAASDGAAPPAASSSAGRTAAIAVGCTAVAGAGVAVAFLIYSRRKRWRKALTSDDSGKRSSRTRAGSASTSFSLPSKSNMTRNGSWDSQLRLAVQQSQRMASSHESTTARNAARGSASSTGVQTFNPIQIAGAGGSSL